MFVELQGDLINLENVTTIHRERPETPEKIVINMVNKGTLFMTLSPDELAVFKQKVLAFKTK